MNHIWNKSHISVKKAVSRGSQEAIGKEAPELPPSIDSNPLQKLAPPKELEDPHQGEEQRPAVQKLCSMLQQAERHNDPEHKLHMYQLCWQFAGEHLQHKDLQLVAPDLASALGSAFYETHDYEQAIRFHLKDLKLSLACKSNTGQARAHANVGIVLEAMHRYRRALRHQLDFLSLAQHLPDAYPMQGRAFGNVGWCYYSLGEFSEALQCFNNKLQISTELEDFSSQSEAVSCLGLTYEAMKDFVTAARYHRMDMKLSQKNGDLEGEMCANHNLGQSLKSLGEYGAALDAHRRALHLAKKHNNNEGIQRAHGAVGECLYLLQDYYTAIQHFQERLSMLEQSKGEELAQHDTLVWMYHTYNDWGKKKYAIQVKAAAKDLGGADSTSRAGTPQFTRPTSSRIRTNPQRTTTNQVSKKGKETIPDFEEPNSKTSHGTQWDLLNDEDSEESDGDVNVPQSVSLTEIVTPSVSRPTTAASSHVGQSEFDLRAQHLAVQSTLQKANAAAMTIPKLKRRIRFDEGSFEASRPESRTSERSQSDGRSAAGNPLAELEPQNNDDVLNPEFAVFFKKRPAW